MKIFHTADWHLGKLVQGVYMTEDQSYILEQFIEHIDREKPDAVIIAGDLYDRAVPPTEAVDLLNRMLEQIVLQRNIPVLAIAGNHDSPDRLDFGTKLFAGQGLHLVGRFQANMKPVVLHDEFGEVHFHLIPYADPALVRAALDDEKIRSHDEAMEAVISRICADMDPAARHVFVGHAFVTPSGEKQDNTSDSERPLSIGGAEYVKAEHFQPFHYTALGHLHQAHFVANETIRYAGSPLKYSASEAAHKKGYFFVHIDGDGQVSVEKQELKPRRDLRKIETFSQDLESHESSEDYVFVTLLDENPVLFPMEKVRAVYPNALHVDRKIGSKLEKSTDAAPKRHEMDPVALFSAFYREVKGNEFSQEKQMMFAQMLDELRKEEGEVL